MTKKYILYSYENTIEFEYDPSTRTISILGVHLRAKVEDISDEQKAAIEKNCQEYLDGEDNLLGMPPNSREH